VPHAHAQSAPARRPARSPPPTLPGLWLRYGAHRYQVVFYSLLLTLVVNPLLPVLGLDSSWLTLFVAFNVLAAVFGVVEGRRSKIVILALTLVALVVSNLPDTIAARPVTTVAFACWMLVTAFAVATSIRYALIQDDVVGREHLYAALSGYLLAGVLFAELYLALALAFPGSLGPAGAGPVAITADAAMYFSFVTLATLGYGDIVPQTGLLRGVAVVEAVAGQLYIAVLVASLMSSYAQDRNPNSKGRHA
jgi:hypothetical protein